MYKNAKIVANIQQWVNNLEVLNWAVEGKHPLANKVLPSLYKILGTEEQCIQ